MNILGIIYKYIIFYDFEREINEFREEKYTL